MTDQNPTSMSPEEAAGRALVARTTFEKEAVWLPSLSVQHLNAGQTFIEGKTFTECLIEGPAVVAVMNGTSFDGCHMGVFTDARTILYKPMGDMMAGVVGMSNCKFIKCRFVQVGFTGSDELLNDLAANLSSANLDESGSAS